jgi:hypothetical protein
MNYQHGLARIFKTIGLALTLGVAMSACSEASWKEEVLLSDGQKIVVTRLVERGGRHEIGQEPSITLQTLRFKLLAGGNEIEWKTQASQDIGLADFQPLNIDIVANNAYVVAWPVGCLAYNKWGRPNPPYIAFKHTGEAWQTIPLKDLPSEIKVPNIIFGSPDTNAKRLGKGMISAAEVGEVNGRLEQPEFKAILREKINYDPQCIPMVSNGKGLWRATAWFETKPTLEACHAACFHDKYDEKHCPCNSIFQRK